MDLFWEPSVFPYSRPFVDGWTLTIVKFNADCKRHDKRHHVDPCTDLLFRTDWRHFLQTNIQITDLLDDVTHGTNYMYEDCGCCVPILSTDFLHDPKRSITIHMHSKYLENHPHSKKLVCEQLKIWPPKEETAVFKLKSTCVLQTPLLEFRYNYARGEFEYRYYYAFSGRDFYDVCSQFRSLLEIFPIVNHLTTGQLTKLTILLSRLLLDVPGELLSLILEYLVISSFDRWMS